MSAALSVVFTGLCALVTGGNSGSGQVLLVDAQGIGEVGGVVLPEHAPTLVTSLRNLANAETSNPTRVVASPARGSALSGSGSRGAAADQIGIWDLRGSEVRIRVAGRQATETDVFRPSRGASSWPEPPRNFNDPASWRDIRFVADMKTLASDGHVNSDLIRDHGGNPAPLPPSLAARIYLDGGRVEAGIPSQEIFRDEVFEFRSSRGEPKLRQAMTDTIRWSLESQTGPVVVEIVPAAGGSTKRLVFAPTAALPEVFVSNLPTDMVSTGAGHAHGLSAERIAALHFGAYYKLLAHEPVDQPLPNLAQRPARRGGALAGTVFCPPVRFDQR